MTIRRVATDLLLVAIGYAIAVIVAVCVAIAFMVLPTILAGMGMWESLDIFLRDLPGLFVFGVALTTICALPGFVLVQLLARRDRWTKGVRFALAGMANAVLALALYCLSLGGQLVPWTIMLSCLPGGLAGGAAYWLAIGRIMARRWSAA